jgi:hypothetical protein
MPDNGELHVVFGTGPVGMSVVDELVQRGPRRVRMVNRSGRARVPYGAEVVGGDATDTNFARQASEGASVVYFALSSALPRWCCERDVGTQGFLQSRPTRTLDDMFQYPVNEGETP